MRKTFMKYFPSLAEIEAVFWISILIGVLGFMVSA